MFANFCIELPTESDFASHSRRGIFRGISPILREKVAIFPP